MNSEEQNSNPENIPYSCDFIIVPRKEKAAALTAVSESESSGQCFALVKRV